MATAADGTYPTGMHHCIVEPLVFHLLITDVQFTEDSDEDWEPESDPETESTKHRLDTRSVHAVHVFLSLGHSQLLSFVKIE